MDVKREDIRELLEFFSKNTYNAWDTEPKVHQVMQRCLDLFGTDYTYSVVTNSNGELSSNYPSSLIILESEKTQENGEIAAGCVNSSNPSLDSSDGTTWSKQSDASVLNGGNSLTLNGDSQTIPSSSASVSISSVNGSTDDGFNPVQELPRIKDMFSKARYARCRARFPVPVILYKKKHICRSATLSGGPEIYGRTSFDYFFSGGSSASVATPVAVPTASGSNAGGTDTKVLESESTEEDIIVPGSETGTQGDWQLFDRVRNYDIRLLKSFQVQTIVDLMVEKKKVKYGVYVTSSEKVDKKNRYSEFNLISLPYPGCEFFKQYRDNGYNGEELMFEWNQGYVDANIYVPSDETSDSLNLEWSQYRKWDLVILTQNYVKLLLAYVRSESSGLLIHCISGWDRTPLFLSLLRLSLWADGAIHKSLNAEQILYLTLSYDWLLFGHNLEDRLNKGEEILFFCFYFLTHIVSDEFSIDYVEKEETQPKADLNLSVNGNDGLKQEGQEQPAVVTPGIESNGIHTSDEASVPLKTVDSNWKECNGNGAHCTDSVSCTTSGPEGIKNGLIKVTSHANSHSHNHQDECEVTASALISSPNGPRKIQTCSNSNGHSNENETVTIPAVSTATVPVHSVVDEKSGSNGEECVKTSLETIFNSNSNMEQTDESCSVTSLATGTGAAVPIPDSVYSVNPSDNKLNGDIPIAHEESKEAILPSFSKSCTVNSLPTFRNGDSTETPITSAQLSTELETPQIEPTAEGENERLRDPALRPPSPSQGQVTSTKPNPISIKDARLGMNKNVSRTPTMRCEKLQLVRAIFYSTYANLLTNSHGVNENSSGGGSGSGLSVIIDNIATKVGIRAPNRSSS